MPSHKPIILQIISDEDLSHNLSALNGMEAGCKSTDDDDIGTKVTSSDRTISSVETPCVFSSARSGLWVCCCITLFFVCVGVFMGFHFLSEMNTERRASEQLPPSNLTVGAYYYPWYGHNFHNRKYLREHLADQKPLLGEYDDTRPEVIAQHLNWSRQANIGLWVTSWWGEGRQEDKTIHDVILPHKELGSHKIALFYETTGRIKGKGSLLQVGQDMEYICQTYFHHPNYFHIDGRPVLFIYLTRLLEQQGLFKEVIDIMRSSCEQEVYLIGDHAWRKPSTDGTSAAFKYLDAVTSYDAYGQINHDSLYAGQEALDSFYDDQQNWKDEANKGGCGFVPVVSPGFNDRGVRLNKDHMPLSRKLSENDEFGSLFRAGLSRATQQVDESAQNLLMVNSWNEFHEDTQIEPIVGKTASTPNHLTMGLEYEGYGDMYLRILRGSTAVEEKTHAASKRLVPSAKRAPKLSLVN